MQSYLDRLDDNSLCHILRHLRVHDILNLHMGQSEEMRGRIDLLWSAVIGHVRLTLADLGHPLFRSFCETNGSAIREMTVTHSVFCRLMIRHAGMAVFSALDTLNLTDVTVNVDHPACADVTRRCPNLQRLSLKGVVPRAQCQMLAHMNTSTIPMQTNVHAENDLHLLIHSTRLSSLEMHDLDGMINSTDLFSVLQELEFISLRQNFMATEFDYILDLEMLRSFVVYVPKSEQFDLPCMLYLLDALYERVQNVFFTNLAISTWPSLALDEFCELRRVEFCFMDVPFLADFIKIPKLKELVLTSCIGFDEDCLVAFVRELSELRFVDVKGCGHLAESLVWRLGHERSFRLFSTFLVLNVTASSLSVALQEGAKFEPYRPYMRLSEDIPMPLNVGKAMPSYYEFQLS